MSSAVTAVASARVGEARSATSGTRTVRMLPSAGVLGRFVSAIGISFGDGFCRRIHGRLYAKGFLREFRGDHRRALGRQVDVVLGPPRVLRGRVVLLVDRLDEAPAQQRGLLGHVELMAGAGVLD